jgi:hypothetical protein
MLVYFVDLFYLFILFYFLFNFYFVQVQIPWWLEIMCLPVLSKLVQHPFLRMIVRNARVQTPQTYILRQLIKQEPDMERREKMISSAQVRFLKPKQQ